MNTFSIPPVVLLPMVNPLQPEPRQWQLRITISLHPGNPTASGPEPALIETLSSAVKKLQPSISTPWQESGSHPSSFDTPGNTVTLRMVTLLQKVGCTVQNGLP